MTGTVFENWPKKALIGHIWGVAKCFEPHIERARYLDLCCFIFKYSSRWVKIEFFTPKPALYIMSAYHHPQIFGPTVFFFSLWKKWKSLGASLERMGEVATLANSVHRNSAYVSVLMKQNITEDLFFESTAASNIILHEISSYDINVHQIWCTVLFKWKRSVRL